MPDAGGACGVSNDPKLYLSRRGDETEVCCWDDNSSQTSNDPWYGIASRAASGEVAEVVYDGDLLCNECFWSNEGIASTMDGDPDMTYLREVGSPNEDGVVGDTWACCSKTKFFGGTVEVANELLYSMSPDVLGKLTCP